MRKLLKNKKIFSLLIIAACIGLFCGANGLQNYYFNQSRESTKVAVENTKKIDNSNKTKDEFKKNELASTSVKKNSTSNDQNKSDSNKSNKNSRPNNSASQSKQAVKDSTGGNTDSKSNTGGGSTVPSQVNFKIIDTTNNNAILAQAYLNVDGKTVEDVTVSYLRSHNIVFRNIQYPGTGGYMQMMYKLYAKGICGWCFWINDTKWQYGESDQRSVLKKGDIVVWKFLADGLN